MKQELPKLRVLAVDDNRTNLHILQVFLKKLGHEVLTAENGQEAVDTFKTEQPDIILLDIMMPIMDGFEAARQIKALTRDHWAPIIFLSALNRDENLVEGLEAGGDDYLTKPINFVILEAKMRSMQRALQLQQSVADANRRMQSVSDAVMEAIITINPSGHIVSGNAACSDIFGWEHTELIGQSVNILMPEPTRSSHDGYLSRYVGGGEPHAIGSTMEVVAARKNGDTFPAEISLSEVRLDSERLFIGVVRDITERKATELKLIKNADELRTYYEQNQAEQALAKGLLDKQLHRTGLRHRRLRYSVTAADNFSGDIVAASQSAEGRFYALLADATGHGLAASISVLPVLALFYRLCASNLPLIEIILEVNQQLRESMPTGRFVAATFVCLDENSRTGEIWIGGTPEAVMLNADGQALKTFNSAQLPLGIVDMQPGSSAPEVLQLQPGTQLVLCSDGLLEAENADGTQFGTSSLLATVANTKSEDRFEALQTSLALHLGQRHANDDISVMLIDCD